MKSQHKSLKDFFSFNDVKILYDNYIEYNVKNLILSGTFKGEFIPLNKINVQPEPVECGWLWYNDPWLKDFSNDKLLLGKSIIENGTYYPVVVVKKDNLPFYVLEGSHRIMSLKLLALFGEIKDDFPVFCLISPMRYIEYREFCNNNPTFIMYRDIVVRQDNFELILNNNEIYDDIIKDIKLKGNRIISKFSFETYTLNCIDIIDSLNNYSGILRDLLYIYNDIKPNIVINNEREYRLWINN